MVRPSPGCREVLREDAELSSKDSRAGLAAFWFKAERQKAGRPSFR